MDAMWLAYLAAGLLVALVGAALVVGRLPSGRFSAPALVVFLVCMAVVVAVWPAALAAMLLRVRG